MSTGSNYLLFIFIIIVNDNKKQTPLFERVTSNVFFLIAQAAVQHTGYK